jgi:hypothetical protein
MAEDEISEEGTKARFAQCDQIGLDRIRADLLSGGHKLVGGPPSVRALAWKWVRMKEAAAADAKPPADLLTLRPTVWGMGFDLKEAWLEMNETRGAARTLDLDVVPLEIRRMQDIAPAFEELKPQADALYVVVDQLVVANLMRILTFALSTRLPMIFSTRDFVRSGGSCLTDLTTRTCSGARRTT